MLVMVACIVINILGQSAHNCAAPLWFNSMKDVQNLDAFVVFLIASMWYAPLFFVTVLMARAAYGEQPFGFLGKYTLDQHKIIFLTGICDALNGILVIMASPAKRTPPIVASLIGATTLLPMIVIKHWYFKVRGVRPYKDPQFVLMLVCYLCAAYTLIYPSLVRSYSSSSDAQTSQVWWLVFFVGAIFGQFYNMQQVSAFRVLGFRLY